MDEVPEVFHGLLRYDALTFHEGLAGAFVLGYRLEDRPQDPWTARFTAFKFDADAVSLRGGTTLMAHVAPLMVDALGLTRHRTVFAAALRSGETSAAADGPLAEMARCCAASAGCRYQPALLAKDAHLPTGRGGLSQEFRLLLIEDAHYRSALIDADTVFVVDDLIATGKTLSLAATAIRDRNPGVTVYGFALAKTAWHSLMSHWLNLDISNAHIPAPWDAIWRSA